MANTVIGVYDNFAQGQSAMKQLLASGFTTLDVHLRPSEDSSQARTAALKAAGVTDTETNAGGGTLRSFFHDLFSGVSDQPQGSHADKYAEAVRRGSFVLTAEAATEAQRDAATAIMEQFQPIDVDERASHWQASGWSSHDESAGPLSDEELTRERSAYAAARPGIAGNVAAGTDSAQSNQQAAIPIIEEQLQVGKREVQRGGVRVVQRIVETPVQETLNLREEHVTVERHAVDQPATAADLEAMKEGTVELREMAEEAVVAKTARVVEEVVIGKEVTEKATTISDTVRRTDVDVQQVSGSAGMTGGTSSGMTSGMSSGTTTGLASGVGGGDDDFRRHWQTAYASGGQQYDDYAPAYQYGTTLANDPRYRSSDWATSEPSFRRDWEATHPHSAWEKVKDAVKYSWSKVAH